MGTLIDIIHRLSPQTPELRFLVAAAAVIIAGSLLSRYGDVFSKKLNLGHAFVGLIFMAFATALPELMTSASSAVIQHSPNMAFGNNFGSIFFNLSILALLDFLVKKKSLYSVVDNEAMVPGAVSLVMIALGMVFLSVELVRPGFVPAPFNVGLGSVFIIIAYIGGAHFLLHHHKERSTGEGEATDGEAKSSVIDTEPGVPDHKDVSLAWAVAKYLTAAVVIAWAGVNLAKAGDDLSEKYSLSKSFIGTIFLAIATSLPEVSATVAMVRRGYYNMAFGNIFGSNAFNVVILAVVDFLYRDGNLFAAVATEGAGVGGPMVSEAAHIHLVTSSLAILMTAIIVIGVMHKPSKVKARLSWPSFLVLFIFLIGAFVTYLLGAN